MIKLRLIKFIIIVSCVVSSNYAMDNNKSVSIKSGKEVSTIETDKADPIGQLDDVSAVLQERFQANAIKRQAIENRRLMSCQIRFASYLKKLGSHANNNQNDFQGILETKETKEDYALWLLRGRNYISKQEMIKSCEDLSTKQLAALNKLNIHCSDYEYLDEYNVNCICSYDMLEFVANYKHLTPAEILVLSQAIKDNNRVFFPLSTPREAYPLIMEKFRYFTPQEIREMAKHMPVRLIDYDIPFLMDTCLEFIEKHTNVDPLKAIEMALQQEKSRINTGRKNANTSF